MLRRKRISSRLGIEPLLSTMKTPQCIASLIPGITLMITLWVPVLCSGTESPESPPFHLDLVRLLVNALAITLIVVVVIFIYALRDKGE